VIESQTEKVLCFCNGLCLSFYNISYAGNSKILGVINIYLKVRFFFETMSDDVLDHSPCWYLAVRPTVIETDVYVNSIGPVDPINMVSKDIKIQSLEHMPSQCNEYANDLW
jgi:hypothetical protein